MAAASSVDELQQQILALVRENQQKLQEEEQKRRVVEQELEESRKASRPAKLLEALHQWHTLYSNPDTVMLGLSPLRLRSILKVPIQPSTGSVLISCRLSSIEYLSHVPMMGLVQSYHMFLSKARNLLKK